VICPEERGAKRIRNLLSRWHTSPPEAVLFVSSFCSDVSKGLTPDGSENKVTAMMSEALVDRFGLVG